MNNVKTVNYFLFCGDEMKDGITAPDQVKSHKNSTAYINMVKTHYDHIADEFDFYPIAAKDDREIFIKKMPIANRGKAIDIGCGTGRTVHDLSRDFDKVYGVDLSPGMIAEAKKRCENLDNVFLQELDIIDLHFPQEYFDYIVSHTTFHHLKKDLIPTLENVKKMLKPGGKIVFIDIIAKGLMKRHAPLVRKIGAFLTLVKEILQLKFYKAIKNYNMSTNPFWMKHLESDRFLEKNDFVNRFSSVFENAKFEEISKEFGLNHLVIVEWNKPEKKMGSGESAD
jgi:ubiquinone/menaquinone biosynthesis C-methylase UbiE